VLCNRLEGEIKREGVYKKLGEEEYYIDKSLAKDDYKNYWLLSFEGMGTVFELNFTTKDEVRCDLYIMSFDEYSNYCSWDNSEEFWPVETYENISEVNLPWIMPDDDNYYLVIDNKNNNRDSDAIPEGNIIYDLRLKKYDIGSYSGTVGLSYDRSYSFPLFNTLFGYSFEKVGISFQVWENKPIDVYICSEKQIEDFIENGTFSCTDKWENVVSDEFVWTCPDSQSYYVVFSNAERFTPANDYAIVDYGIKGEGEYKEPGKENGRDDEVGYIPGFEMVSVSIGIVVVAVWWRKRKSDDEKMV